MFFSLDVLPARKGDCLILHFGTKQNPHLMMIDGGPSNVYKPHLEPRLKRIRTARGMGPNEPLPVDVMMVSHVDDDHIKGILDLIDELDEKAGAHAPGLIALKSLWHNSFDDLLDTTPGELAAAATHFGTAAVLGAIDLGDEQDKDVAMVLASIPQGRDLRDAAKKFHWKINDKFGGKLVMAAGKSKAVKLAGKMKVTAVGPMRAELQALQKKHDEWVRKHKDEIEDSSAGIPAAFVDRSVPNLSSLVFMVEVSGKTMLLTGDARGDKILRGLQLVGLLKSGPTSTIHVDLLKVPHHGSANNLTQTFFKRVTADHYVFSGNGEHGNPEREALEMLFKARGSKPFTIHLTYPVDEIDAERKMDWKKAQAREKKRRAKKKTLAEKKKVKVRPNWTVKKNSLSHLLKQQLSDGIQKVEVVDAKKGHVIDLADSLGKAWPTLVP